MRSGPCPSVFGLGSMGANYGASATGSHTYTVSMNYSFNLSSSKSIVLGLLDMTGYGNGFNSLNFKVMSGATMMYPVLPVLAADLGVDETRIGLVMVSSTSR